MKRRSLLRATGLAAALGGLRHAHAQPASKAPAEGSTAEVVQLVDKSLLGHDLARDFAQGARCCLQDQQSRGRPVRLGLRLVEVDASASPNWADSPEARQALGSRPVVFGAYGDDLLRRLLAQPAFAQEGVLAAPITQDPRIARAPGVLAPYATLDQEIDAAIKALKNTYFTNRVAVVYAQTGLRARLAPVVLEALTTHQVQAVEIEETNVANLSRAASRTSQADTPVTLLLGGAPELLTFVQAKGRSGARRMVVGTSMVDARTAAELRIGAQGVGVMLTQPVPNPQRGRLAVVGELNAAWGRFYDEQVTPMSLAGFMAMKWITQSLLSANAGAAGMRRVASAPDGGFDVGGFVMRRQAGDKAHVELLFLREDGRLVS
jgi:ABC-type branched-subunit amino acid transport system substrate-binding protein